METNDDITVENCRKLLRRAAWRIQYKSRIKQIREHQMLFEEQASEIGFETEIISKIFVESLLNTIPWEKCRYILEKTIIYGMTEKEVAKQLHITQQGVNKWKKKGLDLLRETIQNLEIQ